MTMIMEFFQNSIDSVLLYSFNKHFRTTIFFFNSDDYISTSNVINIICKSTNGTNYLIRIIIIEKLDSLDSKNNYVRQLILKDLEREKKEATNK